MPYEYLEDIAVADIAFHARGGNLEEVFTAAAQATMNVMVEELAAIRPLERREVRLRHEELDLLLFDFLQELIYYKDAERLLLLVDHIGVTQGEGVFSLDATLTGEAIDPGRHRMRADVKAVTLHRFRLAQTERGWEAMVILDI